MDFDYIISNPPYGKSGSLAAKVTKNIIDNLDYKEFVNLSPSSTFTANDKTMINGFSQLFVKLIYKLL